MKLSDTGGIIAVADQDNEPNPKYKTSCGADTVDRIFALSLQEAAELFPGDEARPGYTTLYAQSRGYYFGGKINCWWLRSLGADRELGVGLVSYSMAHHTRQSARGLPFIVRKNYGGREYDVSEYTMSEIIASVFTDGMERDGIAWYFQREYWDLWNL